MYSVMEYLYVSFVLIPSIFLVGIKKEEMKSQSAILK